jgi:hypothetical protein
VWRHWAGTPAARPDVASDDRCEEHGERAVVRTSEGDAREAAHTLAAEEPLEPAEDPGLTLVRFLRGDTLTAHSGAERIVSS